jgi:hypothetical protein
VNGAPSGADAFLAELAATLDALLSIGRATDADASERAVRVRRYLASELQRLRPGIASPLHVTDLTNEVATLSPAERTTLQVRCVFYACDELIALLARRQFRNDAVRREEAMLYVQDRLQRDDFRRIASFDATKGASVRTYMSQVIGNLLIDFARVAQRDAARQVRAGSDRVMPDIPDGTPHSDTAFSDIELHDIVRALLEADAAGSESLRGIRARLRRHVKLTSKERLFLRAMFQYDMSIEDVRALPGFRLEKNEAYRFYYRITDQLLESFKDAGALGAMRSLINEGPMQIIVVIEHESVTLDVVRVLCFHERDSTSAACHARMQERTLRGVIEESFSKLARRLAPWFSAINPTTMVHDDVLDATAAQWRDGEAQTLAIPGVAEALPIGRTQLAALRRRHAAKAAAEDRI